MACASKMRNSNALTKSRSASELAMIDLKRQVNALARELGRAEPYKLAFADVPPAAGNAAKDTRPPAAETQK